MKTINEKRERIIRKKGWAKVGVFVLGILFGFIFTLGALVGVGFWAYKNLNLNKIEKITNSNIDINENIKKITIEDVVSNISGITSDDNYTIAKMEEDFGITIIGEDGIIPEEIYGLSLLSLKQSTLKSIDDDIQDIIGNANINTFLSFTNSSESDLGMFENILNTKIDYYYNSSDNKLYEDEELTNEVTFDYEVNENGVKLNSNSDTIYPIQNNKISVEFKLIAIESAFGSFDKVTNNLQVYKILDLYEKDGKYYEDENYQNEVTGVLKAIAGKTINELSNDETYNNLYIYEVMDYTRTEISTGVYTYTKADGTSVEGIMSEIAGSQIKTLTNDIENIKLGKALNVKENEATGVIKTFYNTSISDLSSELNPENLYIYKAMGYTRNGNEGTYTYTDENGNTVTGVMATLAGYTLNNVEGAINAIKVTDVLDSSSPIIKLFEDDQTTLNSLTIATMSNAVVDKINDDNTTLGKLIDCGLITVEGTVSDTVRAMTIEQLINSVSSAS